MDIYAISTPPHTFFAKSQNLCTKKKRTPHPKKTSHFFGLHNIFFASPERIFEQKTPKYTIKRPKMDENGQKQRNLRKSDIFGGVGKVCGMGPNVNHLVSANPGVGKFCGMALM